MSMESECTGVTALCREPWLWTSDDAISTELEVTNLVGSLVRALKPTLVVETGTYLGQTTKSIGEALLQNGRGRLVTLEVQSAYIHIAKEKCTGLPVEFLEVSSLDYYPQEPVGFAWFDSLPDLRAKEFLRYYPMLERIVAFHDTGPQHDVRPGIEKLEKDGYLRPIFLPTPRGVCLAEVLRR